MNLGIIKKFIVWLKRLTNQIAIIIDKTTAVGALFRPSIQGTAGHFRLFRVTL